MVKVKVKWQKEEFNVELDTTESVSVFKVQLYSLTCVPPEKQNVIVNGGLLKDDADWSKIGLKKSQIIMMIGTAEELIGTAEELVAAVGHSAGLINMGNTCYMNSTVQCLHSVPKLKSALIQYLHRVRDNSIDRDSHFLTIATAELFNDLGKNVKPVVPIKFSMALRRKYPQFAKFYYGVYTQKDAEECWTQLLSTLSRTLKYDRGAFRVENPVDTLFGISLASRVYCAESGEDSTVYYTVYSLKCHISQEVNHLHEGLKRGLKFESKEYSPSLGRSATHVNDSRICNLPRYLTIQYERFFWERESNQKAKTLQKVDFPLELDVYDLCSDDFHERLECPRLMLAREEENEKDFASTDTDVMMTDAEKVVYQLELDVYDLCLDEFHERLRLMLAREEENEKELASTDTDVMMTDAEGPPSGSKDSSKSTPEEGVPPEEKTVPTGKYDLVSVLTHNGRSADSGHYVAWVKQENGKWIQFDDDNVIPQQEEDILRLSGGGDGHMAYICMYKGREV